MSVQTQARRRIVRQAQFAYACDNIRRSRVDACLPVLLYGMGNYRLRNPFHVEDPVTQTQERRDMTREALAGQKRVIAEPSPADALGEDKSSFLAPGSRLQLHFVDVLETSRCEGPQRNSVTLR